MSKNRPLLSIVVPTKNRYETLSVLIDSLLMWESHEFELIIQDNSDDNSFIIEFISKYSNDARIKYFYEGVAMSAIENCDLAVGNSTGKYVTFIGDDDGILKQSIDVVEWMEKNQVDALYCKIGVYVWPDMKHAVSINNQMNGVLFEADLKGYLIKVDAKEQLEKVVQIGAQDMYKIPRLYQGVVSRIVLDKLKHLVGTYFPGPVPDMANAIGIIPFVSNYYFTDIPIIVSGQSSKSMSGKNSQRDHQGDIKTEKSLPTNTFENWTPMIPRFWSAPTIWAEAFIKSATITNQVKITNGLNFKRMYAACFAYCNKKYYSIIFEAMFKDKGFFEKITSIIKVSYYVFLIYLKRAYILLNKILFGVKGKKFESIYGALVYLESEVENKIDLKKLLS
ncbi:MAG: glycosyltransferase [Bacteroidota bacterium]